MPCRPKLCQRLAAQLSHPPSAPAGNNHIWISDELLSEAFNRYVSVSHATRRRGSNVPGPLEARERAAKRRMGMAAAATSIGPAPGGDFGALFGTGAGGNTGENRWAWKPPGNEASSSKPSTKSPSSVWSWASRPSKPPAEWDEYLEMPKLGEDLVERSRAAFEELLKSAKAYGTLDATQVTPLIEFLTSSADEPESKNVSRLVQWLPGLSVSKSAWSAITTLICDKIKLASIDYDELLEVIRALPSALDWKKDDRDRQRLHEICRLFSRSLDARASTGDMAQQAIFDEFHKTMHDSQACADLVEIFLRTVGNHTSPGYLSRNISVTLLAIHNHTTQAAVRTELISQLGLTISQFSSDLILDVLRLSTRKILGDSRQSWEHTQPRALTWLECLTQQSVLSNHLPVVYAELARRLRPYHLAEHFGQLHGESVDIARILLRDWLPNTDLEKLPRVDHTTDRAASGLREFKRVQYSLRDLTAADLPAIAQDFEHLYATEPSTPHLTWLVLIRAFARAGVSYEHVLYDVFHICKSRISLQSMYMLFKGLLTHHDLALPTRCFVYLIEHFLAKGRNDLALKTFQDVPSLSITDVPSLPLALLEDAKVDADMWDLLLRHPESLRLEDRYSRLCNALPEHVELAHLMAHRIATTTAGRLTPLQAFRRVWAVYHWLKDRNAPIQPLLSRSFVTAGILRPIQEHLWIPPAKFEYILSIVEEIEGAEVRTSVEQLASHMRGSVHDKVLAKRYLAKQNAWMKQSTDLAAEMRFRYKRWTKHKPVPTSDGQTFVIPSSSPEPATIWHPFARSTREKPASTQDVGLSRAPPREAKRKMVLRPAGMQADTHFRLKRWTKRKPVPAADGQHFKVPSRPLKPTIVPHSLIQSEDGKVYQQPSLAATTSQSSPETLETSELHSLLEIPAIKTERLLSRGQDDNEREGKDRSRAYPFRKRAEDNLAEANIAHDAEKWRIIQKLRMEKLRGRDRSRKWRKIDPGSRETSIRENWPRE